MTIVVLRKVSQLITTAKKVSYVFFFITFISNNHFQFYEFGIFTKILNPIGFNGLILKVVLISQTICENLDL